MNRKKSEKTAVVKLLYGFKNISQISNKKISGLKNFSAIDWQNLFIIKAISLYEFLKRP